MSACVARLVIVQCALHDLSVLNLSAVGCVVLAKYLSLSVSAYRLVSHAQHTMGLSVYFTRTEECSYRHPKPNLIHTA